MKATNITSPAMKGDSKPMEENVFRDLRFETFGATSTDLAEVYLFLCNAMCHVAQEQSGAWETLYRCRTIIAKELKEIL